VFCIGPPTVPTGQCFQPCHTDSDCRTGFGCAVVDLMMMCLPIGS
jgi:hypothetical protein